VTLGDTSKKEQEKLTAVTSQAKKQNTIIISDTKLELFNLHRTEPRKKERKTDRKGRGGGEDLAKIILILLKASKT